MASSSSKPNAPVKVTIIGDSTIDNKLWVGPGTTGNYINDRLGIKRDDTATRIQKSHTSFWKPELSVVEHLMDILPTHEFRDYSNDGFTSNDVITGGYRDWVFGEGTFSMFPHEYFIPIEESAKDIKDSQFVVLSIGGNDLREILVSLNMVKGPAERKKYIEDAFESTLVNLQKQYLEIVTAIRKESKDAVIILMTQYYPSLKQDHYKVYSLIKEIGQTLGLGRNPDDALEVMHEIMVRTYANIIKELPKEKIVVADITSSLNPFDNNNHAHQIEPSGVGGKKIACMLKYIITNAKNNSSGTVYQFDKDFLIDSDKNLQPSGVRNLSIANWIPRHPYEFISTACLDLLRELHEISKLYPPESLVKQNCANIYRETTKILANIDDEKEAKKLETSLALTVRLLKDPANETSIAKLSENIKQQKVGFFSANKMLVAQLDNLRKSVESDPKLQRKY